MKRTWEFLYNNWLELIWLSCFGAGALVVLDAVCNRGWSQIGLLLLSPAFVVLLCWSNERNIRFQVWGGLITVHILAGVFLYRREEDMMPFYGLLELEAVCLTVCFMLWLSWRNRTVFYLLSGLQLAALFLSAFRNLQIPGWAVCLLLFCQLLFFTELVQRKGENSRKTAGYLVPVFAAAILILCFLPVHEKPLQWKKVKELAHIAGEKLEEMSFSVRFFFTEDSAYSLTFAGYGSEGRLGGSLLSADRLQISIEGKKTNSPLYLAGTIYDTYTGNGWERNLTEKPYDGKEYMLRHKEMTSAFANSTFSREEQNRMTAYRTCEVRYEGLKTASVFLAPVTQILRMPAGMSLLEEGADSPVLRKAQTVGFSYEMKYMELDYASENMKKLMRQDAWALNAQFDPEISERESFIRENYVTLPDSLPVRVRLLAEEITAGQETDYDRMKAIEDWLSAYSYSTQPKECPAGQDFTDFFLFDSDSGYCTYFATAMAVLGRCSGIPTRYVEGFVSAKSQEGRSKTLNLTGSDAHAWVEAYMEHVGWVPFDPTPGYREISNTPWDLPQGTVVSANQTGPSGQEEAASLQEETASAQEEAGPTALERGKKAAGILTEICGVFLGIALLAVLATVLKNRIRRRKYLAADDYEKVLMIMKKILDIGSLYGFTLKQGETLSAFCTRTAGKLDVETMEFEEICNLFLRARFGGGPSAESLKCLQRYYSALGKKYLNDCGWAQGILYRLK